MRMPEMRFPQAILALADGLAFPSLIPAAAAAILLLAASAALGVEPDWIAAGLAAAGTLVVYNVDRLRDTGMDHLSAPLRTEFVEQHRRGLWELTGVAAIAASVLGLLCARDVQLLCVAVLIPGLLHRRLKRWQQAKPVYVAAAWVAVTAGIPALSAPQHDAIPWVLAIYAAAIGANLLATGLREPDPIASLLAGARAICLVGVLVALVGPEPARPLAAIPASELIALVFFRQGERYGLDVLDGALATGAALALALS
jgi:hypothetical protein